MENLSSLLTIALLLCAATLTCNARPEPSYFASFTNSPTDTLSLVSHINAHTHIFIHNYIFSFVIYIFIMFQEMIESKLHDVAGESCEKEDDEDCLI